MNPLMKKAMAFFMKILKEAAIEALKEPVAVALKWVYRVVIKGLRRLYIYVKYTVSRCGASDFVARLRDLEDGVGVR